MRELKEKLTSTDERNDLLQIDVPTEVSER